MINIENIFPTIIIIEFFIAGVIYLLNGKYGSALYWITAGILNIAVTFLMKKYG